MRIEIIPNSLEGGSNLATKSRAKLQKNYLKEFAFVLSSTLILPSFFRQMFRIESFLDGKPKIFRAFHNSFGLRIFSFNFCF